jgi:hypothetical protein
MNSLPTTAPAWATHRRQRAGLRGTRMRWNPTLGRGVPRRRLPRAGGGRQALSECRRGAGVGQGVGEGGERSHHLQKYGTCILLYLNHQT